LAANYLKNYPGALLLISHDRQFMDEGRRQVHEIADKKLIAYAGNYTDYLRNARNVTSSNWLLTKTSRRNPGAPAIRDRFRAVTSKASQAMAKLKQIERMELIEKTTPPRKRFAFNPPNPRRRAARRHASQHSHGLRRNSRLCRTDLNVERGERTVLVGPNGAGKSPC